MAEPSSKRPKPGLAEGVAFPVGSDGRVSTTSVGKRIWSAAAVQLEPELAQAIEAERDWRHNYPQHVCRLADLGAQSPGAAITIAREGLAAIQSVSSFCILTLQLSTVKQCTLGCASPPLLDTESRRDSSRPDCLAS